MTKPLVLTAGEPAGIGPELTVAAWQALRGELSFYWLGDPRHLPAGTPITEITHPSEAASAMTRALPVLSHPFAAPATPGHPDLANAQGVIDVIRSAVTHVGEGQAAAVVTNPIHKAVLQAGADFAYPGHTEYLAALGGVTDVVMMLASPELRVVPATIHIPLSEVPTALTASGLEATIRITHAALTADFGLPHPRIAVAGLNPHAGEDGRMGTEEETLITPLLARLRSEGFDLLGPLSADTMFHAAARARYDTAICMYHDQALIPIKALAFDTGVNVTLGLPFVRTSPDHGTAFDIAGKDQARPDSLIAALRLARQMADARS